MIDVDAEEVDVDDLVPGVVSHPSSPEDTFTKMPSLQRLANDLEFASIGFDSVRAQDQSHFTRPKLEDAEAKCSKESLSLREKLLSQRGLNHWAQRRLQCSVATALKNLPNQCGVASGRSRLRVKVENLSDEAKRNLLRVSKLEVERWLQKKSDQSRLAAEYNERLEKTKKQLSAWHERRDEQREADAESRRMKEEQKNAAKREKMMNWQREARQLREEVCKWSAAKADEDLAKARASAEAEKKARQKEKRQWRCHDRRLKEDLKRWYTSKDEKHSRTEKVDQQPTTS